MKNHILLTVLTVVVCYGIGQAQQCPIGCQTKIDALQNQVAALQKAIYQVPYLQKFILTPTPRNVPKGLFAEQELPNYMNVVLVHVTVDHTIVAVLLPSATPTSNSSGQTPNQAVFAASCRTTGDVLPLARANISVFLGRLRQEASGKDAYVSRYLWMAVAQRPAKCL